jgi:hypothetical protein
VIWPNSVAWNLYTTLASDAVLVSSGVHVQLHELVNENPGFTPWIGVYRQEIEIVPHRVRFDKPWQATLPLMVLVQAHSLKNKQDALDQLDRLLTPVLTAIDSNRELGNTIDRIVGMTVTPFQRSVGDDEDWFFTDLITIQAEVEA